MADDLDERGPAPWERQPYDTSASWAMFQEFLGQAPPRSVLAAFRKVRGAGKDEATWRPPAKVPGSWRNISRGRQRDGTPINGALTWYQRAEAWDDELAARDRERWAKRRQELKEQEWEVGAQLMERARQMLMFPVMTQEESGGKVVIMPSGWRMRDIPAVAQMASRLARLAADMTTDNLSVDWRAEAAKDGLNPDDVLRKLTEQFEAELDRRGGEGGMGGGQAPSGPESQPG